MIKPGIKIGPTDWQEVLLKSQASYAEVYFMLSNFKEYLPMFNYLSRNKIKFGLHFWAKIQGDFVPNLVFKGKIAGESIKFIKIALNIAAQNGAHYVNIHPGSFKLRKIQFKDKNVRVKVTDKAIGFNEGRKTFRKSIKSLNDYANKKNVLLLVETVCKRDTFGWVGNKTKGVKTCPSTNIDADTLYTLAKEEGVFLTNDLGHTLTETISSNRALVFKNLFLKTKKLAPFTKLIHINPTIPPFNGTDAHIGILESDFQKKLLPNKKEIIKLFGIFEDRDDVWAVPEPFKNHVANFKSLKKLLQKSHLTG